MGADTDAYWGVLECGLHVVGIWYKRIIVVDRFPYFILRAQSS